MNIKSRMNIRFYCCQIYEKSLLQGRFCMNMIVLRIKKKQKQKQKKRVV